MRVSYVTYIPLTDLHQFGDKKTTKTGQNPKNILGGTSESYFETYYFLICRMYIRDPLHAQRTLCAPDTYYDN